MKLKTHNLSGLYVSSIKGPDKEILPSTRDRKRPLKHLKHFKAFKEFSDHFRPDLTPFDLRFWNSISVETVSTVFLEHLLLLKFFASFYFLGKRSIA